MNAQTLVRLDKAMEDFMDGRYENFPLITVQGELNTNSLPDFALLPRLLDHNEYCDMVKNTESALIQADLKPCAESNITVIFVQNKNIPEELKKSILGMYTILYATETITPYGVFCVYVVYSSV